MKETDMDIGELFRKYGSDKDSLVGGHSYGATYQKLLEPIRESVRDVLELGVLGGGSLRAWRDFFPNATIVGLDHNLTFPSEERIRTVQCDVADAEQMNAALGDQQFDFGVDDGSHWESHQLKSFELVWPRIRSGGLYVIEDVQYVTSWGKFVMLGAEIIDMRGHDTERGWDNVLAVFRKKGG